MKKKVFFVLFSLSFLICLPLSLNAEIMVAQTDGVVNPVMSEFLSKNIDQANLEKADAVVIELDTPGGLDASMRDIVKKIIASEVPVIVYVSPSGARAASAGVFITLAAHVAAMAKGTNIGAAHPVSIGQQMDETMLEKAENDAAAYIKSLAERRGRNAEWAEKAVRESVSITESEALELQVIDVVAPNLNVLLETIDGRSVETMSGTRTLNTKDIKINRVEMGLRMKILNLITDPNIAYILLLLGFYGIFFELTNPGSIFPGVFGAISLILAFYSLQTLPVNYAGLLLIILAIVLFVLEIKITSYGLLTMGGILSMIIGSLMLFESPAPFLRVSLSVIIPTVLVTVLLFGLTIGLVVRAHMRRPKTGIEGLKGLEGEARTDIHARGQAFVHGEIWSARSDQPIQAGEKIIVEEVNHLTLKVRQVKQ
jgi:membrane-bound serine protease (ClpP class)